MREIVTHGGASHFDEFAACCYLIAMHPVISKISRRDPTSFELSTEYTYVVDVGGLHDPKLRNFDHHQLDKDAHPTCALSMVLQAPIHQDYDDWCIVFPWMKLAEMMDSKGPYAVAEHLQMSSDDCIALASNPIAGFLLSMFQSASLIVPGQELWTLMLLFGDHLITKVDKCRKAWIQLEEGGRMMAGTRLPFQVFDATCMGKDTTGLITYLQKTNTEPAAYIVDDDRGDGYAIVRYNNHPSIDFTLAEAHPHCHYAHPGGFVLKTKSQNWAAVGQILDLADRNSV